MRTMPLVGKTDLNINWSQALLQKGMHELFEDEK